MAHVLSIKSTLNPQDLTPQITNTFYSLLSSLFSAESTHNPSIILESCLAIPSLYKVFGSRIRKLEASGS
ncbi:hypothetical protein HanXRQr2_Chr11g0515761 [Helianthus annuus]|uniref:Uncharacterized protein n=1 Tax=Helianthus annuus TaxID=4232 RepID=A0A251TET3_HELAN|nr:hypothetical protein HanXRQr2_Chr11g0515761 [Helianthus annuus]